MTVQINAGFLPLTDSAILVVARENGFAENHGIELNLLRDTSWANIRDRIAVGHLDMAHLLAPMPLAFNLGLTELSTQIIAPLALGLGGNAVTVSRNLALEMQEAGFDANGTAAQSGAALKHAIGKRKQANKKTVFAVVHPFSAHHFDLRYWLEGCGINTRTDISLTIVPPSLMADALAAGQIDGYCVGEPWNTVCVDRGDGVIIATKSQIWRSSPEKVLGVRQQWAEENADALTALLKALYAASAWLQDRSNSEEAAQILGRPEYLNHEPGTLLPALTGRLRLGNDAFRDVPEFFIPNARAATFPWQSHAVWFYSQMVRWEQVAHTLENARIAQDTYRPDIYRRALAQTAPVPAANSKVEGALSQPLQVGTMKGDLALGPDGFFDGEIFDPDELDAYIARQRNSG